jgi:hypothetical protein
MAILMADFYYRHRKRGQPVASALRGATTRSGNATVRELRLAERWEQAYGGSGSRDPIAFTLMRHFRANPDGKPFTPHSPDDAANLRISTTIRGRNLASCGDWTAQEWDPPGEADRTF